MRSSVLSGACRPMLFAGLAAILLAAKAAAASDPGPASLPGEVIGVVGSGDQLSLRIKGGEAPRTLEIGEVYQDGWTLSALTATKATLTKDGQSQTVGLNPTGVIERAKPDDPPTTVKTIGGDKPLPTIDELKARQPAFDQLVLEQLGPWDGKTPRMGLTLAETQRYVAYQARGAQAPPGAEPPAPYGFLKAAQIRSLDTDADDYLALNQKLLDALNVERGYVPDLGGFPATSALVSAQGVLAGREFGMENAISQVPGKVMAAPPRPQSP